MIPQQPFGRTGHQSKRTIFGAAALSRATQAEADQTFEVLLRYGVNHIDTAASYGDSELRIGPWMKRYRQWFFLATKTGERTYQAAWDGIRRSLERLQVDQVDLLQLHNLVDEQEWQVVMGPGGALEAAMEAQAQGLTRFLGVTGHGVTIPVMHQRSLARCAFDAVLLPYNYVMMQNPDYAAAFEVLMTLCQERQVAVQTIKSQARGSWGDMPKTRSTWYEPLEEQPDIDCAVHWVLSRPGIFLNTTGDVHLLPRVLDAASRLYAAPAAFEMDALVAKLDMTPLFVAETV
jgi:aryl-alcohol dehydrogenase-like predicted oxidoreductase